MRYTFIFIFILWVVSCKVKNDDGLAVLPQDSIDGKFSTHHPITIETIAIDSTVTSGLSAQTFGKYQDPYLGSLQAESYVQFLLSGTNVNFGEPSKLTLDSLVLWLYITSYYGDSSEIAPIYVYEINETFTSDQVYYQFSTLSTYPMNLSLVDNFQIQLDTTGNFKRRVYKIKLDNSLGNKLLFANSSDLQDNNKFKDFFKGLKISSGHQNLMLGFDVITDSSRLVLHYKVQENDTLINKTYNFYSDFITAAKFTHFKRISNGTLYEQVINTQSQEYGFISAGVQNQLHIKISMDSLQNVMVNRAELEIPVDTFAIGNQPKYLPPSIIFVYTSSADKKIVGTYFTTANYNVEKKIYSVILTEKLNNYLRGTEENHGIILVPVFPGSSVNRAVIRGPQNLQNKMRLKVYSTQIK